MGCAPSSFGVLPLPGQTRPTWRFKIFVIPYSSENSCNNPLDTNTGAMAHLSGTDVQVTDCWFFHDFSWNSCSPGLAGRWWKIIPAAASDIPNCKLLCELVRSSLLRHCGSDKVEQAGLALVRSARWNRIGRGIWYGIAGKGDCSVQTRCTGRQDRAQPLMASTVLIRPTLRPMWHVTSQRVRQLFKIGWDKWHFPNLFFSAPYSGKI